jgi:TPR repeat protein
MYGKGLGIPQNIPEAIRLFEAVANLSDSSDAFAARIELGRIHSSGEGVPVDTHKALKWYEAAIALAAGHEDSDDLREARTYVARTSNDH